MALKGFLYAFSSVIALVIVLALYSLHIEYTHPIAADSIQWSLAICICLWVCHLEFLDREDSSDE